MSGQSGHLLSEREDMATSTKLNVNDIKNERVRKVVSAALDGGWEYVGINGGGHGEIRWPATGVRASFSFTPSDWRGALNMAQFIKRSSGVECWTHQTRRKSRKKDQHTDFSLEQCQKEQSGPYVSAMRERNERLRREHMEKIEEFRLLRDAGDNRTVISQAREILHRILEIEKGLENLHQPFTPFDASV